MPFRCAQASSCQTLVDPIEFPKCLDALSLDAGRSKCVSDVLKCALARRLSIQMLFLCAQTRSRSTPAEEIGVDPGPFGMTGAVPSGKFWEEQDGLARRRAVRGRVRINTANSRRLGRF